MKKKKVALVESTTLYKMWVLMDSNHRSRKTADLQSAPFGHSGKHPWFRGRWRIRTVDPLSVRQIL